MNVSGMRKPIAGQSGQQLGDMAEIGQACCNHYLARPEGQPALHAKIESFWSRYQGNEFLVFHIRHPAFLERHPVGGERLQRNWEIQMVIGNAMLDAELPKRKSLLGVRKV
ncbi:hypothetical protein MesoLj131a_50300 [Mesorhizobium sp. 131-2-1]|nr:hypothetical protein MesoLj131a_50300 [Mesorhizobium sp. 131-2-1]